MKAEARLASITNLIGSGKVEFPDEFKQAVNEVSEEIASLYQEATLLIAESQLVGSATKEERLREFTRKYEGELPDDIFGAVCDVLKNLSS